MARKNTTKLQKLANNTFRKDVVSDKRRKIEFEIGDEKQKDFYPQFKTKHWDNEANLSVRLVEEDYTGDVTENDGVVEWIKGTKKARLYEKQVGEADGFEFEVELGEKPESNIVEFSIQTKGLRFFYQAPLNEEIAPAEGEVVTETEHYKMVNGEKVILSSRPENVVGSYAVYHETGRNNTETKHYETGKAFHIYRPYAYDASGERVWCKMTISESDGKLTIEVPESFLERAQYPVVVDPTFGYTNAGASTDTMYHSSDGWSGAYLTRFSVPENALISKITARTSASSGRTGAVKGLFYAHGNDGAPDAYITNTDAGNFSETAAWTDATFSADYLLSAGQVWLGVTGIVTNETSTGQSCSIAYDTNNDYDAAIRYGLTTTYPYATPSSHTPFVQSSGAARLYSVYATYTAQATATDVVEVDTDEDTFYGSTFSTGPNASSTTLAFGGWGDIYHSYLQFNNLPDIDQSLLISAKLWIYVSGPSVNDPVAHVRRVTSAWDDSTLTSANLPTENSANRGSFPALNSSGWKSADITNLVMEWMDGISTNYGLKVHSTVGSNQNNGSYDSLEGTNHPYIELTLVDPVGPVDTAAASGVADDFATLNGEILDDGDYTTGRGFVVSPTSHDNPGSTVPASTDYETVLTEGDPGYAPVHVQRGEQSMAAGVSTATVSLSTPVPVGKSFAMLSVRADANPPSRTLANATLQTVVDGHYTELLLQRSFNTTTNVVYTWEVVDCDDFTVQTGESTLPTSGTKQLDVSISAVDLSKTFVAMGIRTNNTGAIAGYIRAKLTSTTNLQLNAGDTTTSSYSGIVRWYVVEWEGATVQSGENTYDGTVGGMTGTMDVTISAVDLSQSFVMYSWSMVNFSTNSGILATQATLTSTTNLRFFKNVYYAGGPHGTVNWFVVSHPMLAVQAGTTTLTAASTGDANLSTAVDTARTFLPAPLQGNASQNTNANTTNHHGLSTRKFADTDTLTFDRGINTNNLFPAYFAVEDQTSVYSAGEFSLSAFGLTPETTYYYRAWVYRDGTYAYGPEVEFTTTEAAGGVVKKSAVPLLVMMMN